VGVLEVEVDEVEEVEAVVAAVEELVLRRCVVVVLETWAVVEVGPSSSLLNKSRGTVTPAAMTITAAAMPNHRPSLLFLGGAPGVP
jgi:hypothetical protein